MLSDASSDSSRPAADGLFHRARLGQHLEKAGFKVERLRTYCAFAPFAAGLSRRMSARMDRAERAMDFPFGNLLAAVGRNP